MNQKTLSIAYCTDNQLFTDTIVRDLQRVNYTFKPIPCTTADGLQATLANEQQPILLIISDNFLKSTDCMHNSLAMLRQLSEQKQFLPIIVDGQYQENGTTRTIPTTFERVSNVIQYMNYWQDAYLAMRREKRQMDEAESAVFEEKLKRVRTISSEVGEFLRYLRNTSYIDFNTLKNNHYESIFRLVNDQTAFYEYKQLGDSLPTVATAVVQEETPIIPEITTPTPPPTDTPRLINLDPPTPPTVEEQAPPMPVEVPEVIEETLIPAGALMMEEVEEEATDEATHTTESVEKGIEASASNGVLAAFHEGMEQEETTPEIVDYNENQPELEESLANFDLAAIPGIDQITARANGSSNSSIATNLSGINPSNYSNGNSDASLEDILGETPPPPPSTTSTNLEAIINETIAEENEIDIQLPNEVIEEEEVDINDIFTEVESTPTAPTVEATDTIESLLSQQPVIEKAEIEDSSVMETSTVEADTSEMEELPKTLEQIIEPTAEATIEEGDEDEKEDAPIRWDDLVNESPEITPPVEDIDTEEEPVRWNDLVSATEEETKVEAAEIVTDQEVVVAETESTDLPELAVSSAGLVAALSDLPTDLPATPTESPINPAQATTQAQEYFTNGQIEDGIQTYQTAIAQHPEHTDLRYQYALALIKQQNDFAGAKEQLQQLLTVDDKNSAAYFKLAELAEMQGEAIAAKEYYEKVASIAPDYPQIDYRLGIVHLAQPDDQNLVAAKHFKTAIQKRPQFADAYYQLALLLKNYANKPAKAVKFFEKTLQVDAQHPFAAYDLADTQQELGHPAEAAAAYAKAIIIHPDLRTEEKDRIYLPTEAEPIVDRTEELLAAQEQITQLQAMLTERDAEVEIQAEQIAALQQPSEPIKTVMITGATSGIGRATAELFAKEGHRLIITGRRSERLMELKDHFNKEYDSEVETLSFDVRDIDAVNNAIETLSEEWRQIDLLINNAGLASGFAPIHEGDLSDWERMIDTNIKGLLYMTRAITPHMVELRSGHIINIGSIAGKYAYPNGNVYNATKFAVDGLTQAMRLDLYPHNIRVSQVAPGHVEETEFALVRFHGDAEQAKIYEDFQPLTARDIADTIYFIATRPAHVNVQDVLLMGTQQGGATFIDRSGR